MTKKQLIICISVFVVVILIISILFICNKKETKNDNEKLQINSQYDEETGLYYIRNEVTNEIIHASQNEEELEFYKENPDYNPNPLAPKSTDLNDYMYNDKTFYNNEITAETVIP